MRGKLLTERMVPIDEETMKLVDRITAHRSPGRPLRHPRPAGMSRFWPVAESAQADYGGLRAAVLATGALPADVAAACFRRRGLAGLIAWPAAEPVFVAGFRGAARPAWSPYADPRLDGLAAAYRLLLAPDAGGRDALVRTVMEESRA